MKLSKLLVLTVILMFISFTIKTNQVMMNKIQSSITEENSLVLNAESTTTSKATTLLNQSSPTTTSTQELQKDGPGKCGKDKAYNIHFKICEDILPVYNPHLS